MLREYNGIDHIYQISLQSKSSAISSLHKLSELEQQTYQPYNDSYMTYSYFLYRKILTERTITKCVTQFQVQNVYLKKRHTLNEYYKVI